MPVPVRKLPSQAELRAIFDYEEGELLWNSWGSGVRGRRQKIAGDAPKLSNGYRKVSLPGGQRVLAHRVIWVWHHGDIPDDLWVDHINRDKLDNRIENLALKTWAGNQRNTQAKNKTGLPKHVHLTANGRYAVILRIGTFDTVQEAEEAAKKAVEAQHH